MAARIKVAFCDLKQSQMATKIPLLTGRGPARAGSARLPSWQSCKLPFTLPIHTETQLFQLEEANEALACLRDGRLQGAAVLRLCEK